MCATTLLGRWWISITFARPEVGSSPQSTRECTIPSPGFYIKKIISYSYDSNYCSYYVRMHA